MKWYRELIPAAPDDLNGFFAFLTVPPAAPFPETSAHEKNVRHCLDIHGAPGESRGEHSIRFATSRSLPLIL